MAVATLKGTLLQIYRMAILVAIAWIIRAHDVRLRVEGFLPITLEEVRGFFPKATDLQPDPSERSGMFVKSGSSTLGYVIRTAPVSDSVIGYRGWTDSLVAFGPDPALGHSGLEDTLIAFDPAMRVIGVRIHASQDTREHVEDITEDATYLKTWNGKSWNELAGITPEEAGIEGVSGATMTSLAIAEGIMRRIQSADAALAIRPPPFRWTWKDTVMAFIIAGAVLLAFTGTHGRKWLRIGFQAVVFAYVGVLTGNLLAQSLFTGWMKSGVPWNAAPGLVLLAAAALALPWTTGKPVYCQHLCPHGALQEWIHRLAPKRWRLTLHKDVAAGLKWLPGLLLATIAGSTLMTLPLDPAHLEPFDAYIWRTAGLATIAIAIAGLLASARVPMAYCRYGCPTGALLEFVRPRGVNDHFSRRDAAALLLVLGAALISWKFRLVYSLLVAE